MSFTRKEEKLLHDEYFNVIRETEQFVEVQSQNTGHCWSVFKNTIERSLKVTLYHKHKMTDQYYHQHRICRTVAEAVEQIKSHDAYVLEQQELKKNSPAEKGTRKLKVYGQSSGSNNYVPTIMLKGKWVEDCGFNIGDGFNVLCEEGRLTITRV